MDPNTLGTGVDRSNVDLLPFTFYDWRVKKTEPIKVKQNVCEKVQVSRFLMGSLGYGKKKVRHPRH